MIKSFEGETNDRHRYKAMERTARSVKVGLPATPPSYRRTWTVHADDGPVGMITLRRDTEVFSPGFRQFGPALTLFIRPAHRRYDYVLEVVKRLLRWIKARRLFKVIHARHRCGDQMASENLTAANFLYTGCKTYEPHGPDEALLPVLHVIQKL